MIAIKTLVELFDTCQIENVIAALRFKPEKIVFVGFKKIMTRKKTEDLQRFFEMKQLDIQLEYRIVPRYDYEEIVSGLNAIIDENEDAAFDLTGGKELVLVAMGEISAARSVPMFQFDVRSGEMVRVKNCENVPETEKPVMSIEENIVLSGGVVVEEPEQPKWNLTEDFEKDTAIMWDICRKSCRAWNRNSGIIKMFEAVNESGEGLFVKVSASKMRELPDEKIMDELVKSGMIKNYAAGDVVTFEYKNDQVRRVLNKAGNILELSVYINAKKIQEQDSQYYDDIDTGVFVDWDGESGGQNDTRNEIDIFVMRDLVPVFVSCKNGEVHKEALYELNTVAEKFGGEYAKKVLVCTYISYSKSSREYILQRARDMKIEVVEDVDLLSGEEFLQEIRKRIR